jgi:hypothetical protein
MVVTRFYIVFPVLLLLGCQSEEEARIEQLQYELSDVISAIAFCDQAITNLQKEQGAVDLATWDKAAASDLDNIDPKQESEIRKSLARELGIAPSEVDWKGIYEARAEAAKKELSGKNYSLESARNRADEACIDREKNRRREDELTREIRRVRRSANA